MKNILINQIAAAVNVVDSIVITEEYDTSIILAEWIAYNPNIVTYGDLTARAVRLTINWSDKAGTIDLQQGDFFTFIFPDIFRYDLIQNVTDVPIKNQQGETVATYSIYDNTRPDNIEVILLRDGEVYAREVIGSRDNWMFGFCCLPKQSNTGHNYVYTVDEANTPDGYTKEIKDFNIINTLN